jgi:isopenicillin N synthase-like dioxygenase
MQETSSLSIAPLETVDFSRLVTRDEAEISKLLVSCQTHGFFYLDLQNAESRPLLEDAQHMVRIMENYFAQPLEVKMKDDRQSLTLG